MKTFRKSLIDFNVGDPVLLFGDTVYVISKEVNNDIVNLILSGGFNHSGFQSDQLSTYGKPKRVRRSTQKTQEDEEYKSEIKQFEINYQTFLKDRKIDNSLQNFKMIQASQVKIGDIIKRSKKEKCEEVIDLIDMGDRVHIVGYMGTEEDERYGRDIEIKTANIYVYKSS